MSQANAYGVTLVTVADNGHDARGNRRYRVTWRDEHGAEASANTRGQIDRYLANADPSVRVLVGDSVNVIRDGRGSVLIIERHQP